MQEVREAFDQLPNRSLHVSTCAVCWQPDSKQPITILAQVGVDGCLACRFQAPKTQARSILLIRILLKAS